MARQPWYLDEISSNISRRGFVQATAAAIGLTSSLRAANGFIRKPYLQRLQLDKASILWTTPEIDGASVTVTAPGGSSTSFTPSVKYFPASATQTGNGYYQYQADITGLQPGTSYQYRVASGSGVMAADPVLNNFTTPAPGNFSFLVFGDSGASSPEQMTLIQRMTAEQNIAKVIHVGDMAYMAGTFAQFESNYFALNAPLMSRLPFFTTPGNHEYLTDAAAAYVAGHTMPDCNVPTADVGRYYSFDWGDAHFVSLDSNLLPTTSADRMLAWLDADLAASQKFWKIVFLHHPPYPTGTHRDDPICALVRQNVNPIVERYGVQLVLTGHEHGYERSFPLLADQKADPSGLSTTYVITGGGGGIMEDIGSLPQCALALQAFHYMRVDVTGSTLTFVAIGLDGSVLDRVTLTPPPSLKANGIRNAGDYSTAVAPGSLVSIFGRNLAPRSAPCQAFPLPEQLGGVSVTVNGRPAPLLFASPTQINVQMPYEISGQATLQLTTPNGSATAKITVSPTAPSILAITAGGKIVSAANPVKAGDFVALYVNGLGAAGGAATGQAAPPLAMPVIAPVEIFLGSSVLPPLYAGLAPGFAGVGQINFQVPANFANGAYPLQILAGAANSAPVTLNVGSSGSLTSNVQAGDYTAARELHRFIGGFGLPRTAVPAQ